MAKETKDQKKKRIAEDKLKEEAASKKQKTKEADAANKARQAEANKLRKDKEAADTAAAKNNADEDQEDRKSDAADEDQHSEDESEEGFSFDAQGDGDILPELKDTLRGMALLFLKARNVAKFPAVWPAFARGDSTPEGKARKILDNYLLANLEGRAIHWNKRSLAYLESETRMRNSQQTDKSKVVALQPVYKHVNNMHRDYLKRLGQTLKYCCMEGQTDIKEIKAGGSHHAAGFQPTKGADEFLTRVLSGRICATNPAVNPATGEPRTPAERDAYCQAKEDEILDTALIFRLLVPNGKLNTTKDQRGLRTYPRAFAKLAVLIVLTLYQHDHKEGLFALCKLANATATFRECIFLTSTFFAHRLS